MPGQLGRTLLIREALKNAESEEKLKAQFYLHELIRQRVGSGLHIWVAMGITVSSVESVSVARLSPAQLMGGGACSARACFLAALFLA